MTEFIIFFKKVLGKKASAARNSIHSSLKNRNDDLCICFCLRPSSKIAKQDQNGLLTNMCVTEQYPTSKGLFYSNILTEDGGK